MTRTYNCDILRLKDKNIQCDILGNDDKNIQCVILGHGSDDNDLDFDIPDNIKTDV